MTTRLGLWASILNYGNEEGLGMKGMEKDRERWYQVVGMTSTWRPVHRFATRMASFTLRQPSAGVVDTFIVSIGSP